MALSCLSKITKTYNTALKKLGIIIETHPASTKEFTECQREQKVINLLKAKFGDNPLPYICPHLNLGSKKICIVESQKIII